MKTLIIILLFTLPYVHGKRPNFSIENIKVLPRYEKYEFQGVNTNGKQLPVVFEYTTVDVGSKEARWLINGKMKLNKTQLDETYTVDLNKLHITNLDRLQKFDQGQNKTTVEYNVNTATMDETEFVISTVQGLMYLLRTYPFESKVKEITVRTPQQTKGKLNFKAKNKGKIKFNSKKFGSIDVYHLELSLIVPAVGALIPKLNFYIRNDSRKTLVALKGIMPGNSGKLNVELVNYQSKL